MTFKDKQTVSINIFDNLFTEIKLAYGFLK